MANATINQTSTIDKTLLRVADLLSLASNELKTLAKGVTKSPSQAWFWSRSWQKAEKEADKDIRTGKVVRLTSVDDLDKSYEELF